MLYVTGRDAYDAANLKEDAPVEPPACVRLGLEAGQAATLKWLDFYRRMGIEVTPEMTLVKKEPVVETAKRPDGY